jgi:glycosyltransferase involved in cell wall biosynthesis
MTICIFDQYFPTLGGGERHIGVVAEILLRKHEVYIIHTGPFEKSEIESKLNLNLSKAIFIDTETDEKINEKVTKIVKDLSAELFINATHFSQLYIEGIVTLTLVFFPKYIYPRALGSKDLLKSKIGEYLFGEYDKKIEFVDFYHPEHLHEGFGRWSRKTCYINIDAPFKKASLFYEEPQKKIFTKGLQHIKINEEEVKFKRHKHKISFTRNQPKSAEVELNFDVFTPAEVLPNNKDKRKLGMFITNVYIDSFSLLTKLILKLWRTRGTKNRITRLYIKSNCVKEQLQYKKFLQKNAIILSNSKYTTGWINKIYGNDVQPHILYPPVIAAKPLYAKPVKSNKIIAVGRFFTGDHSKKQLELIKFFKQMYDRYPSARSYTLHLCGGTHKEKRNQEYLQKCYMSAEGYPIKIHPNISFDELRELYADSKIFWHGAGLYENEQLNPDKFEHLGFTTIEAMASGCVPIVIGIAGQLEVVDDSKNGYLWTSGEELIAKTNKVMQDEALWKTLSDGAIQRAGDFSYKKFENNVYSVFNRLNIDV